MKSSEQPVDRETNLQRDTIAAVATPPGRGGIGIIRVSGPDIHSIAKSFLGRLPEPRRAEYMSFMASGDILLDQGIVLYFPAPNSFTGEDVLEIQGHGGPVVLDSLLKRVLKLGARLARPGEFSERAFLNGRLDLIQVEAISDLINAETEQAARAAARSLQGEFSKHITRMEKMIISLRTHVEASIDFSDEKIDFLKHSDVEKMLNSILFEIKKIKESATQGALLREGMSIAIVGYPNVGKSSLLNKLTRRDSAIVMPIAGTTRDAIREKIYIDGLPIYVVDTAGLRETEDETELQGIKRSLSEIEKVDLVLFVVDCVKNPISDVQFLYKMDFGHVLMNKRVTVIRNKIDLNQESARFNREAGLDVISLSVKTDEGLTILHDYLKNSVGYQLSTEGNFSARRRHLQALSDAEISLTKAMQKLLNGRFPELLAEDLSIAQNYLGTITGKFTTENLLGEIFSSFCIGK